MTAQRITPAARLRIGPRLILPAAAFFLLYLSVDFIAPNFASSSLPLPNSPAAEARAWFAENPLAASLTGILQLASVLALAAFVVALGRVAGPGYRARTAGLVAVACMAVSSVLAWVLAAVAPSVSDGVAGALRTANFIAGGTAHVVALGVFVLLAARLPEFGRGMRVFAWIAAVPALASVISLFIFEGAALILLGRLLCMVWVIAAAIAATVRIGRRARAR
jgi:hypothetical protein